MKNSFSLKTLCLTVLTLCSAQFAFSITQTWTGAANTDFNNPNNWSPVGAIANNDLIITHNSTLNLDMSLSATVTVNSLTMSNLNSGDLILRFGNNNLTTIGDLSGDASNAIGYLYIYQDGGNCTVGGNFSWCASNGPADCYYQANTTNPGFLTFMGDVTIGLNGRTIAAIEPDILFDGVGTQTVTMNNQGQINGADYFLAEDLQIGNVNTPTVVIAGTYQNSGGIRCYDGTTVLIKAGCKVEANGSSMDKLGATSGTWTMEAGSELEISGTYDFPIGYTTYSLDPTSTTEYNGTNQSVTAHTYGHLEFTGSGTKTSAGSFHIKGNLLTNTAFGHGNDVHTFSGATAQNISGSVSPTFYTQVINNTSTGVFLFEDVSVSNLLTLTDGLLHTNANTHEVTNPATTSVNSYSTNSYVNTGSTGTFRRYVNATGTYDFPLGNANTGSYQLMELQLTGGSSVTYFDSRFENMAVTYPAFVDGADNYLGVSLNNGGANVGVGNANTGVWTLDADAGTATYNMTLYGRNHDNEGPIHTVIKRSLTTATIHSEDFSGGGTGSWTTSGTTANFEWESGATGCDANAMSSTTNGNGYAYIDGDCDGANNAVNTAWLVSPVLNCSAYSNISLAFEHHYDDANSVEGRVQVNINGGGWTDLAVYTADQANVSSVSLPVGGAAGAANVQFRFQYKDKKNGFWLIDDIAITGQTAPYTAWAPDGATGTSTTATPITAGRTGLSGFSQFAIAIGNVGLPIELIEFTAVPNGRQVDLNWETATEIDNDYFTIEKSIDGEHFELVGIVDAVGNSTQLQTYDLIDEDPYDGLSYYRLKQTDVDGSYTYSTLRTVQFNGGESDITIYPNPHVGDGPLFVAFNSASSEDVTVEVRDYTGRLIQEQRFAATTGENVFTINTQSLGAALYFITVKQGEMISTSRYLRE